MKTDSVHHKQMWEKTILIVDDESENLRILAKLLSREGFKARPADRPELAIASALSYPPDLILLDVKMPGMNGFDVCRCLKTHQQTRDIPIIFVSGLNTVSDKLEGFQAGGVDFISKPFQEPEVLARIRNHLNLHHMQTHLETMVAQRTEALSMINEVLLDEISKRKKTEEVLRQNEAKYRNLVDNTIVGVFHARPDGELIFANHALARMYGFDSPGRMMARKNFNPWQSPELWGKMLALLSKIGQVKNFEAEIMTLGGKSVHIIMSATLQGQDITGMIMDISKRKTAEQAIRNYQRRLKALASQLTLAEEKERRRIAADLHDHIGQNLVFARIQVAKARMKAPQGMLSDILEDLSQSLLHNIRDTRNLVFDLSSPLLNEIGLSAAISNWLKEQIAIKYDLETTFSPPCEEIILDDDIKAILFRNVRELLTNVVRHARANMVSVKMKRVDEMLIICIQDDGIGFNPDEKDKTEDESIGFGLFSIQERMSDYGGSLEILSEPGRGCKAILSVPINKDMN